MQERHEQFMKRRMLEEDHGLIEGSLLGADLTKITKKTKFIHESPDGGKTVKSRPIDINLEGDLLEEVNKPDYAFDEDRIISEIKDYIDSTYDAHYSQGKYQATQFIEDAGHGMGFALGNVLKYAQRYGKKDGHNRKDLLKVIHYGIIAMALHDREHEER